jgi:hypothetical protein
MEEEGERQGERERERERGRNVDHGVVLFHPETSVFLHKIFLIITTETLRVVNGAK